jgi:hypothetical protein
MGPLWDFDMAAGNSATQILGYTPEGIYAALFNYWFRNLMERPEFFEAAATRWNEIRHTEVAQTIERIQTTATRYQNEFQRDFQRHPNPVPFMRPYLAAIPDFHGNVNYLTNWLEARASWLDKFFNNQLPDYCALWSLVEFHRNEAPVGIKINGQLQTFTLPPIRLPYATKISLQDAARIFNFRFENDRQNITMRQGNITITHRINTPIFTVNNEPFEAAASSINIRQHTFVPLRIIAELFDYDVDWLESERTVTLSSF